VITSGSFPSVAGANSSGSARDLPTRRRRCVPDLPGLQHALRVSCGVLQRCLRFTGDTSACDPPERMLPLYFALVGCLTLSVNRGVAVLLIPEVENLLDFVVLRPLMTPTTAREAQVGNAADAALQAQVRLRAKAEISASTLPGCYAMTFMPTPWASQQKSRVATIHVPPGDEKQLDRFCVQGSTRCGPSVDAERR
jgi:hypothetical protein